MMPICDVFERVIRPGRHLACRSRLRYSAALLKGGKRRARWRGRKIEEEEEKVETALCICCGHIIVVHCVVCALLDSQPQRSPLFLMYGPVRLCVCQTRFFFLTPRFSIVWLPSPVDIWKNVKTWKKSGSMEFPCWQTCGPAARRRPVLDIQNGEIFLQWSNRKFPFLFSPTISRYYYWPSRRSSRVTGAALRSRRNISSSDDVNHLNALETTGSDSRTNKGCVGLYKRYHMCNTQVSPPHSFIVELANLFG